MNRRPPGQGDGLGGSRQGPSRWLAPLVALAAGAVAWGWALPDVAHLATQRPATTALIEQRKEEASKTKRRLVVRQNWVSLERISPKLQAAVILSEDASFWGHEGIDWFELKQAIREDLRSQSFRRGASTLSQQLVKNLFYGTRKSLLRKLNELFVTLKLEQALNKKQILGLYLNVVEWGEGIFGIEAASRAHFGVSAASLSAAQAAILTAMLPAPRRSKVTPASAWLRRRSAHVLKLLHATKRISEAEFGAAQREMALTFFPESAPAPVAVEAPEESAGAELPSEEEVAAEESSEPP